jgi:hypothetical protein
VAGTEQISVSINRAAVCRAGTPGGGGFLSAQRLRGAAQAYRKRFRERLAVCSARRDAVQVNIMNKKKCFTLDQAKTIGAQLGITWDKFDLQQFRAGLAVELEHGTVNQTTNVTNDDPLMTGKIALAHLTEFPDYYTRLARMETEAESFWDSKKFSS